MFAEANVDEEIAELVVGFEVRGPFVGGPAVDGASAGVDAVPAAEGAGTFRFEVERGAEGDDTFDLGGYTLAES